MLMNNRKLNIEMVGDVLTRPFSPIKQMLADFDTTVHHHDIDLHVQVLRSGGAPDVLISHVRAEYFLESGGIDRAEDYCAALEAYAARNKGLLIINTLLMPVDRVLGSEHIANLRLVSRINSMLLDCAERWEMISVADIAGALARVGINHGQNLQNDLVMRMPYTKHAIAPIVEEYSRCIRERFAPRKKAIMLDADNTLWRGVVGEDGINGIDVDHLFPGIVHRRFQQALLKLRDSGILLCLVTKNNEADVREAFDRIDMPLEWADFTATRANWLPKSQNIASIAAELNIGTDSLIFIDDNPFELDEVSHSLPTVDCYRFEINSSDSALGLLSRIKDISTWTATAEDLLKSTQYFDEGQRKTLASQSSSIKDYIQSLDLRIEVGINRENHVKRIAQLTTKTNQFNLTTRRYSESDVFSLMEQGQVFDFRVIDRFGDMGIVGVAIVKGGEIDSFLMSCRALGRQIESNMLKFVCDAHVDAPLRATYVKTAKNGMVADFYDSNGFALQQSDLTKKDYVYDTGPKCSLPIEISTVI
jgi:FkbH-like protein